MAATRYRDKRRSRKAVAKNPVGRHPPATRPTEALPLVALGTVGARLPAFAGSGRLSVLIAGRFEVRVESGFDAPTLARLVRTLEQLA